LEHTAVTTDTNRDTRVERDSLGDVHVPNRAFYGAQTQRAVDNFQISGQVFDRRFIRALGLIKLACAGVNRELEDLDEARYAVIANATQMVVDGQLDEHFPLDIFQTGSGTSTNMNANEVIANQANVLAGHGLGAREPIHPNDHVNMGQSSNDVIPTALNVSAYLAIAEELLPALAHLADTIDARAARDADVVKTGRTHLMDAMPLTVGQEMSAWSYAMRQAAARLEAFLPELGQLALGGTAVGTGVNTRPGYGKAVAARLAALTGHPFQEADNHFACQGTTDTAVAASGLVKATAVAMLKVANDLRWMNSGPQAGLGEVSLPALQPGSSIMPGKINPVIPEAVVMVCARVMGNDVAIAQAAQLANFQLAVGLPVTVASLLESITLLAAAATHLADKAIADMAVNTSRIGALVGRNPILVTALNPVIGYDKAAQIAKRAYAENRLVKDVAREMTDLSDDQLDALLDPRGMTSPK
jgi:fumarate hydratase class II